MWVRFDRWNRTVPFRTCRGTLNFHSGFTIEIFGGKQLKYRWWNCKKTYFGCGTSKSSFLFYSLKGGRTTIMAYNFRRIFFKRRNITKVFKNDVVLNALNKVWQEVYSAANWLAHVCSFTNDIHILFSGRKMKRFCYQGVCLFFLSSPSHSIVT